MEETQVNRQRFAVSYTLATQQGKQIRRQQVQHYVARVPEPGRSTKHHSDFHIGLYGRLWIESMDNWSNWAEQLMRLKPQKRRFFLRGGYVNRFVSRVKARGEIGRQTQ